MRMDWKTFILIVFAIVWTNRDEVAQRYQDIKKGGVQPLSDREQYIKERVAYDANQLQNDLNQTIANKGWIHEHRQRTIIGG